MPEKSAKKKIDFLIADSQADRCKLVEAAIGSLEGPVAQCCEDGRVGRDILLSQQVGFVIAAVSMPHMTGVELLRLIRRNSELFDLPVLLLIDQKVDEKIQFVREEGADEVLVDPITETSLLEAITRIKQARQERTSSDTFLLEARCLFLKREYDDAIQKTLSIEGVSDNREALHLLCECYYRQKNYDKALQYLKRIISSPTSRTLHLLSKVCLAEDQCGDAIVHLTKANRRYPSNLDLKIDLGKLYLSLGMGEQAQKEFEGILKANPSDLNLIKMGKAQLANGNLRQAATFLDQAEKPIPETAHIFAQLANGLEAAGDLAGATRQYEKCLRLVPNDQGYMLKLSKLYLKANKRDRAEAILNYLHKKYPDSDKINNIITYLQTH